MIIRFRGDAHLWLASAACVLGLVFAAAEILIYVLHPPIRYVGAQMAEVELWQYVAQGVPMLVVGFLLVARRATPRLGWILLIQSVIFTGTACLSTWLRFTTTITASVRVGVYAEYALWQIPRLTFVMLPLFFPSGRLAGPWSRRFAVFLAGTVLAGETSTLLAQSVWHPGPATLTNVLYVPAWEPVAAVVKPWLQLVSWTAVTIAALSPLARWRAAGRLQRRQIAIIFPVYTLLLIEEVVRQQLYWSPWIAAAKIALSVLVPATIGYAIIHSRLYELDRAARRIVAAAVPLVLLAAVYAAAAFTMSAMLHGDGSPIAAVLAVLAALVGLVLRPISQWVLGQVDRLLYGYRARPYGLARQLAARIRDGANPAHVPNAVCQVVVSALRLPGAALEAVDGEHARRLAAVGQLTPPEMLEAVELRYHGRAVGRLLAMPRSGQTGLDDLDRAALQPLADLAAPAVSTVLLHEELASSRARLVRVREEERDRLSRDVHDGVGPSLAAIRLQVDAAVALLPADAVSGSLLARVSQELRDLIAEMRGITDDLRPPALERLGLAGAVVDLADRLSTPRLPIRTNLVDRLPQLPAPIELAAYRITAEALANAVRHAAATSVLVTLAVEDDTVTVRVADDGAGISPVTARRGVGLSSMAQRARDVGGSCDVQTGGTGTAVVARLPIPVGGSRHEIVPTERTSAPG